MEKKEKLRSEVKAEDCWDLSKIYQTIEEYDKDYEDVVALIEQLKLHESTMMDSATELLNTLIEDSDISRKLMKVYMYTYLRKDENQGNNDSLAMAGRGMSLFTKYQEVSSFITPTILKYDPSLIRQYMDEEKGLERFRVQLEDTLRYKKHVLTEKEEKLLSSYGKVFDSASETASLLRNNDLQIGTIVDESGDTVALTEQKYSLLIQSKDRRVRKDVFEKLYRAYEGMKNTFSSTYSTVVELDKVSAATRDYPSAIEAALFQDNVDLSVYNNLIKTVKKHLPTLFEYYQLKKEILDVEELHLYDIYVDVASESKKTYTFEEAEELVKNALSVLGEDYIHNASKAFTDGWIDKYPNKGKRSGAYSFGSYDTVPYMFLNFQGRLDDVFTLAHELGHSMHSFYSDKFNSVNNADYKIFVAEVASTTNEVLLARYMLKHSKDKLEKLAILEQLIETFKGTIFRQTMFAEFEQKTHAMAESGEILTSDAMGKIYYDLNCEYFGTGVVVDSEIQYEWIRIPHFYTPFYVYKYATGLSAATYIATSILEEKEGALENYLEFLKSGCRDYPIELLKIAGVDMSKPDAIDSALKTMKDLIDEFKQEINS